MPIIRLTTIRRDFSIRKPKVITRVEEPAHVPNLAPGDRPTDMPTAWMTTR
jgi:hypothetical protein